MKCLTGFHIKLIALVTMLIDHAGAILFPQYFVLRLIGRLSFPLFCFLLIEGYTHTRDVRKYLLRLGIFAWISEAPFDIAFYGGWFVPVHQNIFFTLFLGILAIFCMDRIRTVSGWGGNIASYGIAVIFGIAAEFLHTDYGLEGVLAIAVMHELRYSRLLQSLAFTLITSFGNSLQVFSVFSAVPMCLYNGEKGYRSKAMQYIFYVFYPVHLLILYGILKMKLL